jgi:hypothetical protein
VGSGNSSIALVEAESEADKTNKKEKEVFKVMECGTSGSQLADMEKVLADVKKKISDAVSSAGSALAGVAGVGSRRRKREDKTDDEWACAKLTLPGKAYRSCVKKTADFQV